MAGMARSEYFKTPLCRFSYVQNMFKPVQKTDDAGNKLTNKDGSPALEWQCTLIFPKSADKTPFDNAIRTVITEQWGDAGLVRARNGLIATPYIDGEAPQARNKKTGELHPGMGPDVWFIRVSTRIEPSIRFRSVNVPAQPGEIKSGDYGFAAINAYAWSNPKKGDGVSFGIEYLQKTKDGESLGGSGSGADANKYFETVEDTGSALEETKGGQGASGLFG